MRLLLRVINIAVLLTLGYFAQDNLIAEFHRWFPKNTVPASAAVQLPNSGSIQVIFSPNQGATGAIVKAIGEAQRSILVSAYSFTSQDIAKALLAAKKRQVKVRLILDKSQVTQRYSSVTFFSNLDFDLRIDTKHAIFHNKVMIIDDKTVITGSFNFTKAAETKNAENVLILRNNPSLAKVYKQEWEKHWHQSVTLSAYRALKS